MYKDRKKLYSLVEKKRKRPLITYVTSIRNSMEGRMAQDVIPEFINQLENIDEKEKSVDLLIISNGGDPIVSWRIISMLRERFDNISVLIPYKAFSSATMLSLGADEIIMHPYANLGPIDLQINYKNDKGENKSISYEDILKYFDFANKIDLNDKDKAFEKLTDEIPATLIGFAQRSHNLEFKLGEKLLATHENDKNKINKILNILNAEFYHHGYPLGRSEAKEIGLNVIYPDKELEKLIWDIYIDFMNEYNFNEVFDRERFLLDNILNIKDLPQGNNTIVCEYKIASLESININSYINEKIIANFSLNNKNINLDKNFKIKPGSWKMEKGEKNVTSK